MGGIKPSPALVWAVLYRHAAQGIVTRSNSLLAKDVGVSRETIKRAIGSLRKEKILRVVRQGGRHVWPTTYKLGVRDLRGSVSAGSEGDDETSDREGAEGKETEPEAKAGPGTDALKILDAERLTESPTTMATGLPELQKQGIGGSRMTTYGGHSCETYYR